MKTILSFTLTLLLLGNIKGQNIVFHNDLYKQLFKNEAFRSAAHGNYNNTLVNIKEKKEKTTGVMTSIYLIQKKVFEALTSVSDAIKNVRTIGYIAKYTESTLVNVTEAIQLAANKPYLVEIASKQSIIIYDRMIELTAFIHEFVLQSDESILIKPTERDRFVYTVYRQILVLHSMSEDLCNKLKRWTFQDAVYNIVPLNQYYNQDKKLVEKILKGWHF